VKGLDAANGTWTVTRISDAKFSLDGSKGSTEPAYTSGGRAFHALLAASRVKKIRRIAEPFGEIYKKFFSEIERLREQYATAGITPAKYFYEELGEYLSVHIWPKPTADILTEIRFVRIPLDCEAPSATTNPIVPRLYDKLLYQGTVYHILDIYGSDKTAPIVKEQLKMYELLKERALIRQNYRRLKLSSRKPRIKWL